jgi:hypothetical protein
MYQIRTENERKSKKRTQQSKFNNANGGTIIDKPNEEIYECVTCGFKVQKAKFN